MDKGSSGFSNKQQQSLYEKYSKSSLFWKKDVHINFTTGDEDYFDDFFSIYDTKYHKIKKITIFRHPQKYIKGFQIVYSGVNAKGEQTTVQGFKVHTQNEFDESYLTKSSLELKDDEYVIEIFGRNDQLGFRTDKGRSVSLGGDGGSPFSYYAPEGYHISCLAGACDDTYLKQVKGNIYSIKKIDETKQIKFHQTVIKRLISFLTMKEISNMFLCKTFKHFRGDTYVINEIGRQCIFSCNDKNIEYLNQLIKYESHHSQQYFEYLDYLMKTARNRLDYNEIIRNTEKQNLYSLRISKWTIDQKDQFIIETSHSKQPLTIERNFSDLFTQDEFQDMMKQNYALVAGVNCKDSGQGGHIVIDLDILNENGSLFEETQEKHDISSQSFLPYYIIVEQPFFSNNFKDISEFQSTKIRFTVQGQDAKMWAGFYGPKIQNIFIRLLPVSMDDEKAMLGFTKRHSSNAKVQK